MDLAWQAPPGLRRFIQNDYSPFLSGHLGGSGQPGRSGADNNQINFFYRHDCFSYETKRSWNSEPQNFKGWFRFAQSFL
jgi:hypothetical protein